MIYGTGCDALVDPGFKDLVHRVETRGAYLETDVATYALFLVDDVDLVLAPYYRPYWALSQTDHACPAFVRIDVV